MRDWNPESYASTQVKYDRDRAWNQAKKADQELKLLRATVKDYLRQNNLVPTPELAKMLRMR